MNSAEELEKLIANSCKINNLPIIGNYYVIKSIHQGGDGNGIKVNNLVSKLYSTSELEDLKPTGVLDHNADYIVCCGFRFFNIRKDHIIREATEEEILQNYGCK